jgi:hypothetical protein
MALTEPQKIAIIRNRNGESGLTEQQLLSIIRRDYERALAEPHKIVASLFIVPNDELYHLLGDGTIDTAAIIDWDEELEEATVEVECSDPKHEFKRAALLEVCVQGRHVFEDEGN